MTYLSKDRTSLKPIKNSFEYIKGKRFISFKKKITYLKRNVQSAHGLGKLQLRRSKVTFGNVAQCLTKAEAS